MNAFARSTLAGTLLLAVVPAARAQEERQPGEVFRDCPACPEMIVVPAGSFRMGSWPPGSWWTGDGSYGELTRRLDIGSSFDAVHDEGPPHQVTIGSPFAVGVYEVTFAEWDACVNAGGCEDYRPEDEGWGRDRLPVIHVSWEDAQNYVQWLSRETGEEYRLLSEAEWEYVAWAGRWKEIRPRDEYDLTRWPPRENTGGVGDGYAYTAPAGSFRRNPFGLYDILGNVWEWTEDCWNEDYSGAPADGSAWRSGDCAYRALRGGSWHPWDPGHRPALRGWSLTTFRAQNVGFRVARTLS